MEIRVPDPISGSFKRLLFLFQLLLTSPSALTPSYHVACSLTWRYRTALRHFLDHVVIRTVNTWSLSFTNKPIVLLPLCQKKVQSNKNASRTKWFHSNDLFTTRLSRTMQTMLSYNRYKCKLIAELTMKLVFLFSKHAWIIGYLDIPNAQTSL